MSEITPPYSYGNGYIVLDLPEIDTLPSTVVVEDNEFVLKNEFHITLVAAKKIANLINNDGIEATELQIIEDFKNFLLETPLDTYTLTDQYRFVQRDDKMSIVQMAEVPGVQELFASLEEKYRTPIPLPPIHVSLYTLQPDAAISIISNEQLETDTHVIPKPAGL